MRPFVMLLFLSSVVVAQATAVPAEERPPSGHSFTAERQQIDLRVTFFSVPRQELARQGVLPRTVIPDRTLKLADQPATDAAPGPGIRLISAETIVRRQLPVGVRVLSQSSRRKLGMQFNENQNTNVFFAPRFLVWNGEEAQIADAVSRPYLVALEGANAVAGPQIDTIEEGTRVVARPSIQADGSVQLDLAIRFSQVGAVKQAGDPQSGGAVQVPELHASEIKLSAAVPDGDSLLIVGMERTRLQQPQKTAFAWFSGNNTPHVPMQPEAIVMLVTPRVLNAVGDAEPRSPTSTD